MPYRITTNWQDSKRAFKAMYIAAPVCTGGTAVLTLMGSRLEISFAMSVFYLPAQGVWEAPLKVTASDILELGQARTEAFNQGEVKDRRDDVVWEVRDGALWVGEAGKVKLLPASHDGNDEDPVLAMRPNRRIRCPLKTRGSID
jgi:hypothetical protein